MGTWPLVGRAEELRMIGSSLTSLGDCSGVVIAGPAGVGKSRLARESLARLDPDRWASLWVGGTESARALPFGALAEWAGDDLADDPLRVVRTVIRRLTSIAPPDGRVVIGIDDAHLLDDLSAFVVLQLVSRRLAQVVVTIRTGERAPDAVTALWKERYVQRVELKPLSREDFEELLQAVLGGNVEHDLTNRMWELTRGNALYLRHLLYREHEDGRIFRRSGAWRWDGHPLLSETLVELIEQRIGRLSDQVGDVVDIVALAEPITASMLADVCNRDAAEEAERRGLIVFENGSAGLRVRLAHPLYGELRHAQCGALRLQRLSGKVATAFASTPETDSRDTVRRAALWINSDLPADRELYRRAAVAAMALTEFPLAERFAKEFLRTGPDTALRMICAHALAVLNRGEEAESVLACAESDSALSVADRIRLVTLRAIVLLYPLARPEDSAGVVKAALYDLESVESTAAQHLLPIQCLQLAMKAGPREAIAVMQSVDRAALSAFSAMMSVWGLVIAFGDCGRVSEARCIAEEGYRIANENPETIYQTVALAEFHVVALWLAGYVHEATDVADRIFHDFNDMPGRMHAMSVSIRGLAALGAGHTQQAHAYLLEGTDGYEDTDSTGYWYRFSLFSIHALAMDGNRFAAAKLLEGVNSHLHPSFGYVRSEHLLASAWVAAAGGEMSTAISKARQAAEFAAQHRQWQREMFCLHIATRFGDSTTARRLRELVGRVDGPRVTAAAMHATSLEDENPVGLHDASLQFEKMGDLSAAADAAAHAATVYRRRDRNGSALTEAERAQRLAEMCGITTLALREALQPSPLTPRQREIVSLAALGMSNKDIADRLTVSVRTIEGHLYRASLKTGIAGRDDLGATISGASRHRDRRT